MMLHQLVVRVTVLVALSLALVSCGGSHAPSSTPTAVEETKQQSDLLLRSSDNAAAAASFSAIFHGDMQINDEPVSMDGTIAFRSPSQLDMKFSAAGEKAELLFNEPDVYVNVAGNWYSIGDA